MIDLHPHGGWIPHTSLQLQRNRLEWLPCELDRLAQTTGVFVRLLFPSSQLMRRRSDPDPDAPLVPSQLIKNPLSLSFGADQHKNARPRFAELFFATTHIGMIRERAATVCFALQDLELPAPLTLEILDALFPPNNIRMWAKWELITAVKHFHQRHERAGRPPTD
jgi:hypothetical protein